MSTWQLQQKRTSKPNAPTQGSFPIDHFKECKDITLDYLACLRRNRYDNKSCRYVSKKYLLCRMDKELMFKQPLETLGFYPSQDVEEVKPRPSQHLRQVGKDAYIPGLRLTLRWSLLYSTECIVNCVISLNKKGKSDFLNLCHKSNDLPLPALYSMYTPVTYWHDPYQSAAQTNRRLKNPLHYHLRRHDYIAFQRELLSGTSPFIQDDCGRTPLDLALLMMEDLLITCLCTSFPVDFLIRSLNYDSKFPAKFVSHYAETYADLYDHPNALRLAAGRHAEKNGPFKFDCGTGSSAECSRFTPTSYPAYRHDTLPSHAYDHLIATPKAKGGIKKRKVRERARRSEGGESDSKKREVRKRTRRSEGDESDSEEKVWNSDDSEDMEQKESEASTMDSNESSQESECDDSPYTPNDGLLRPPDATTLQRLFQDQMVVVVEDAVQHPTPKYIKDRLNELVGYFRGLWRVIDLLMTSEPLRILSVEYRMRLFNQNRSSSTKFPGFVLQYLSYPYLFMATLQNLFEMYPLNPSQTYWNINDVADARRLVNLVLFKKLKGHEVVYFLSQIPKYMCAYIRILGVHFFKPHANLAQYLMHFSFCMDSPDLFYFSCRGGQPFSQGELFPWDSLIKEMLPFKKRMMHFLIPLVTTKLRSRVQQRLVKADSDNDESIDQPKARVLENTSSQQVYTPFEERYLTQDFLKEFATIFGTSDLENLKNMLRCWDYEVVRSHNGETPTQMPTQKPFLTSRNIRIPPTPAHKERPQSAAPSDYKKREQERLQRAQEMRTKTKDSRVRL